MKTLGQFWTAINSAMDAPTYARVHDVANGQLFIGLADTSGRSLAQQQSGWITHPDRVHLAWKTRHVGAILSIRKALALAPEPLVKIRSVVSTAAVLPATYQVHELRQRLDWGDADDYDTWKSTLVALKALAPILGVDIARQLAIEFSERGSDTAKADNDDPRYDPVVIFDRCVTTMSPDAARGWIFKAARAGATAAINAERGRANASKRGKDAAQFLQEHHRAHWDALIGRATA